MDLSNKYISAEDIESVEQLKAILEGFRRNGLMKERIEDNTND